MIVLAHSGSLDDKNGHYDQSKKEYHYHTGINDYGTNYHSSSKSTSSNLLVWFVMLIFIGICCLIYKIQKIKNLQLVKNLRIFLTYLFFIVPSAMGLFLAPAVGKVFSVVYLVAGFFILSIINNPANKEKNDL